MAHLDFLISSFTLNYYFSGHRMPFNWELLQRQMMHARYDETDGGNETRVKSETEKNRSYFKSLLPLPLPCIVSIFNHDPFERNKLLYFHINFHCFHESTIA